MRTHPAFLRRGVAAALLEHLIARAPARAMQRPSLETGSGPAFEPARSLYRRRDFVDGEPFARYERTPSTGSCNWPSGRGSRRPTERGGRLSSAQSGGGAVALKESRSSSPADSRASPGRRAASKNCGARALTKPR